ncbi:hypothetical protein ACRAWF_42675 [Streptomyces sp. L7]
MKKTRISLAGGAVAGVLLLGALAVNASANEAPRPADSGQAEKAAVPPAPPTPEWVNPDGTVDESKMPEELPLIGADGKVVKDADGKTLMVKTRRQDRAVRCAPGALSRSPGREKRSTSTDAEGRKTETVEVEASVPPAHRPRRRRRRRRAPYEQAAGSGVCADRGASSLRSLYGVLTLAPCRWRGEMAS